ncbi:hypothetical protein VIGAN_09123800 [Vigna angularis var. angularis]|uniref:Uncharacterized protein n=1 Tax=Vigna angularis var. angularis TaxID=157739 RepID=A0A0S3SXV6_PHAAN|nr:hypothetical protein VIGAN_09123800 [Vigna angularis var. angularis]
MEAAPSSTFGPPFFFQLHRLDVNKIQARLCCWNLLVLCFSQQNPCPLRTWASGNVNFGRCWTCFAVRHPLLDRFSPGRVKLSKLLLDRALFSKLLDSLLLPPQHLSSTCCFAKLSNSSCAMLLCAGPLPCVGRGFTLLDVQISVCSSFSKYSIISSAGLLAGHTPSASHSRVKMCCVPAALA